MSCPQRDSILLVENEQVYLDVLVSVLQPSYHLTIAKTGEDALRYVAEGDPPSLVLLDIQMPGMDGYETCRSLKADHRFEDIPIVFLTARNDPEDEAYGLSLGAVDYIAKPISPATLLARIQTHLQLRQARRALQAQNAGLERRVRELLGR